MLELSPEHTQYLAALQQGPLIIDDLIEIRAPDELTELRGGGLVDPDWARRWPAEQIWRVRKMDGVR